MSPGVRRSVQVLLESAIDYAGCFPPAALDLQEALRRYVGHRSGPHAWMLGRLVVPASRIEELEGVLSLLPPPPPLATGRGDPAAGPALPLSLVLSRDPEAEIDRAMSLARRWEGKLRIAAVELPPPSGPEDVIRRSRLPPQVEAFVEVPPGPGLDERLAAVADAGVAAKVRTGGPGSIVGGPGSGVGDPRPGPYPPAGEMARFLLACSRNHIAFKATAGLHHPFRRPERLVPGAEGSGILMHGFMNLAIAAVLVHAGKAVEEEVAEVFEERSPEAFEITDGGIAWRGRMLDLREIGEARRRFFRSFGSCSFREPATGLEERGLV